MIDIVLAADKNYIKHLYVTAQSIRDNTDAQLCFHILSNEYPFELHEICNEDDKILFYDMSKYDFSKFPLNVKYITIAGYYRLFLPELLPSHIDKVLYLDVDLIVRKDIKELFDEDISDVYAGAITDEMDVYQCGRLALSKYFNSGVLLLNMKKLRQDNMLQEFLDIVTNKKSIVKNNDQDILNIAFQYAWKTLPLKWNSGSVLFQPDIFCDLSESVANVRRATHDPAIVHFTGEWKPWQFTCCHPYKLEYLKYLLRTPLYGYKLTQVLLFLLSLIVNVKRTFKERTVQLFRHDIVSLYGNNSKTLILFGILHIKLK